MTFGSDSGNAVGANPVASFGLDRESLENYSGDSIKRTRDTAMALVDAYYGADPSEQYFAGGSKGGHEALIAAQDYGHDYDGIIAYYPANQNQAMVISWFNMAQAWRRQGGALTPEKTTLLAESVMAACDGLDGLKDGVIADVPGCNETFKLSSIRCPSGADEGNGCLSQTQIGTVRAAATPFKFAFELANGVTEMGAYPVLEGAPLTQSSINGWYFSADALFKYFVKQDGTSSSEGFDYRDHQKRVGELSRLLDATDPDIDNFVSGGGKLILVQGTTDTQVTPHTTTMYYDMLQDRYGADLHRFSRYYIQPGHGHAGGVKRPGFGGGSQICEG